MINLGVLLAVIALVIVATVLILWALKFLKSPGLPKDRGNERPLSLEAAVEQVRRFNQPCVLWESASSRCELRLLLSSSQVTVARPSEIVLDLRSGPPIHVRRSGGARESAFQLEENHLLRLFLESYENLELTPGPSAWNDPTPVVVVQLKSL